MVLTESISCSFVDRDMFMRHFGHGVGHLQYDRQHEIEHDHDDGRALEEDSDSTDNFDHAGDSVPEDLHDSDEEEEIIDEEGGWERDGSDIIRVSDSDSDGSDGDSYTSY